MDRQLYLFDPHNGVRDVKGVYTCHGTGIFRKDQAPLHPPRKFVVIQFESGAETETTLDSYVTRAAIPNLPYENTGPCKTCSDNDLTYLKAKKGNQ